MDKRYSIAYNRLKYACYNNMQCDERGIITRTDTNHKSWMLLQAIDGGEEAALWGRLKFNVALGQQDVYTVYAFAMNYKKFLRNGTETDVNEFFSDESVDYETKLKFLEQIEAVKNVCINDMLLYELSGRYLWIMLEVYGDEPFAVQDMTVYAVGDNFMETFPEVYRERGSFFHRYMSIYSSIYNDFQEKIDNMELLFDVEKAPAGLLEVYAGWFGIDVSGGFLKDKQLRLLAGNAFELVRQRGTYAGLEKAAEIALGEKVVIVERNLMSSQFGREQMDMINELYGDSPFDVLILTNQNLGETEKSQLLYFLRQFVPVRCRLDVVYLTNYGQIDKYAYLGINAQLSDEQVGALDENLEFDDMIVLAE